MATSTLDIEVELHGARDVKSDLKKVGEAAGGVAQKFDESNSKLGEGLSSITDNVSELGDAFGEVGGAISNMGNVGAKGLFTLVPAIGGVVMAGMALWETFKNITGAAQEAEDAQEAMAAASSDLQSKLEALAEKGVVPATKDLYEFGVANLQAQLAKEKVQKVGDRLSKLFEKERKAVEALKSETNEYNEALRISSTALAIYGPNVKQATSEFKAAERALASVRSELQMRIKGMLKDQEEVNKQIADAAKMEKKLEETSLEATLARVKEKQAELAVLEEREAVILSTSKEEEETLKRQAKLTADLIALQVKENDKNVEVLRNIEKELDAEIDAYNQEVLLIQQAAQEELKASKGTREEKVKDSKLRQQQQLALERQRLLQTHQLEIARLQFTNASALELLEARYQQQRQLAEGNRTLLATLDYRFETEKTKLIQAEETKRRAEEAKRSDEARRLELQRREFIISNLEFDAEMMEDGTKRELTILELKYRRERELKQNSEIELTELTRRYNLERQQIEAESIKAQIENVAELTSTFGSGFAEAAYSAVFFGESFKDSMADIIGGLGKQAAVEALIQTAKGTAALILNPAVASNHFASAGIFAGAAVAAGTASAALGGGGGMASPSSVSPSGLSQVAPEPERERADSGQTVFNINFGGAVVYDTKQAAERAFADRITQLQNVRRRGAPRRSF